MDLSRPASPCDRTSAPSPFKVDEGYSEEPRSQNGDDMDAESTPGHLSMQQVPESSSQLVSAKQWLLHQSPELRADFARSILLSLPNFIVSEIVQEANLRLHFDPLRYLPEELVSLIFNYLDPQTLFAASLISKTWRHRAFDPLLWRQLFRLEGWTYNRDSIVRLETHARTLSRHDTPSRGTVRPRPKSFVGPERDTTKRLRDSEHGRNFASAQPFSKGFFGSIDHWATQNGEAEADDTIDVVMASQTSKDEVDLEMQDANVEVPTNIEHQKTPPHGDEETSSSPTSPKIIEPSLKSSLIVDRGTEGHRVNWEYLYTQRRRLEQNWNAGRFTNFRLPSLEHDHERHSQCVYTIQYSEKHLVSGSRDKTVRVWDLANQRLKMPPLEGHEGSVLCLQFDERPEQDVIISGGSDADVIIWKFSTGEIVKRMKRAHTESVLNLRFDDRYLVTCSKDRTIRVWNRQSLLPTDTDYPRTNVSRNAHYPDYIVNMQAAEVPRGLDLPALEPYSLLFTLEGHGAAVNAIQIYEDQIVSASGDRKIMLWDIPTGSLIRTFTGHSKGIACVQYDGRRVVSGSSDNSVRIFDSETTAEVALLEGHNNLVRTVQADFGDIPGDDDTQEEEARANDQRIIQEEEARNKDGRGSEPTSSPKRRESTSRKPFVLGAKLPPGGGGNKWSKIVSGSYDESVIIWRIDKDGNWYAARELRQELAMRATEEPGTATSSRNTPTRTGRGGQPRSPNAPNPTNPSRGGAVGAAQQQTAHATASVQHHTAHTHGHTGQSPATVAARANTQRMIAMQQQQAQAQGGQNAHTHPHRQAPQPYSQTSQSTNQQAASSTSQAGSSTGQAQQPTPANDSTGPGNTPSTQPHHHHHRPPLPTQNPAAAGTHHHHHLPAHMHPHHPHFQPPMHHQYHNVQGQGGLNSRVFKLQFDARRIICCSQETVIVGWDFANGDKDIIEACQYFGEPKG